MHTPAALRSGARFKSASVGGGALSHPVQPTPTRGRCRSTATRVGYLELDLSWAAAQRQMCASWTHGMLECVGESLLGHPEHGQLNAVGKPVRVSLHLNRHRDARGMHASEQLVEAAKAR